MSENVRALFGYEPRDFIDDSGFWANHIHPDDRDRVLTHAVQIFITGHYAHEYRFLHADGEYRWVYNQLQLMRDAVGNPTEMIGYLVDISERKQVEAALRHSEAKNRGDAGSHSRLAVAAETRWHLFGNHFTEGCRNGRFFFLSIKNISEILPPALLEHQLQRIKQALATGELQVWEQQLLKHGQLCDEETRLIPCGDDEVLVIVRNIGERKQAEEALQRYERIVSATTDAISLLDCNYVYKVVNQAYLNWYNKASDEIVGHSVSEFLPLALYETTIKPKLDQCLAGQVVQYEMWADYTTVEPQFLSVTYNPYFDANQSLSGVVVSLRNRTQLKQAEMELELQSIVVRNMADGVSLVKVSDGLFCLHQSQI